MTNSDSLDYSISAQAAAKTIVEKTQVVHHDIALTLGSG
jgi:hypothetical protein